MGEPVSRETPAPDWWLREYQQNDLKIKRFVDLLATAGVERGLIGPREASRLWERHIANCAVLSPLFLAGVSIADVGSGAGLPGIVVALARPDLQVTLIEPLLRRTTFLTEAIEQLDLPNVTVVRARAERLHGTHVFDVVTARAVAPLDRLVTWCWPLVKPGGELVAMKGETAADEVASHAARLGRLPNAGVPRVERLGMGIIEPLTTVVRIQSQPRP